MSMVAVSEITQPFTEAQICLPEVYKTKVIPLIYIRGFLFGKNTWNALGK